MTRARITKAIRAEVLSRSRYRCEYCQSSQQITAMPLHIDHITPLANDGATDLANLCAACPNCNGHKSSKTEAHDPVTGQSASLFHPRQQSWNAHFRWMDAGARIEGTTPTGRATVIALDLNATVMVKARRRWIIVGWHPPRD